MKNPSLGKIFLLFFFLVSLSESQEVNRTNITITKEPTIYTSNHTGTWHFYDAYIDTVASTSYIKIKVVCESISNYAHMFVSSSIDEPNYQNSDYKNINPEGVLIIPGAYYIKKTKFVVGIEVRNTSTPYNFSIYGTNEISLERNMGIEMIFDSMSEYTFTYDPKEQIKESLMFTAIGPNLMNPVIAISYGDVNYTANKVFENGKGIVIPSSKFAYKEGTVFKITISCDMSTLLQIGVKHVPTEKTTPVHIRMLDNTVIIIDNASVKEVCYVIEAIDESPSHNETRHYMVSAKSFTQNAYFYVYDSAGQKEVKGVDIVSSSYMNFDYGKDYQLCIKPSSGYANEVSAQFQVMDMEFFTEYQPYKEPLIRGVTHEEMVPKGKVMYYRIPSLSPFTTEVQMNMHFIKGYPRMYKGFCNNFPNCTIKPEDIDTLIQNAEISTANDINGNIYLNAQVKGSEAYQSSIQTIAIVYCPDDPSENVVDCVFDISLECPGDISSLLPNTRYNRPINYGSVDLYNFRVTDSQVNKLYVVLYSFSGNADLYVSQDQHFVSDMGTYYAYGNREYIVIEKNETLTSLVGEYYAQVVSAKNTYYSIFYYTENSTSQIFEVPSGEVFMETISMGEKKKTFYLTNRNIENNVPFLASIHSINCNIKVHFNGTEYADRLTQVVIDPSDPMYKDQKYKFDIEFVNFDSMSTSPDERCLFYFAGDESMEKNELLLNEGVFHQMSFNNKINYISYIYPLVYAGPAKIVFSVNKYSDQDLKIHYRFQGREGSQGIISNHHRKIELQVNEIEEYCTYGEPCPLIIEIEPEVTIIEPNVELRFQIEVLSSAGIPAYLTLGEIRYNRLNGKKTNIMGFPNVHYYYSDIAQGTVGEINIDFLRGSGNAVAKVIRKDVIEEFADWNRRIELPDSNSDGIKRLDYYDKRIVIHEQDTAECPQGCEIYIQVFTENLYSEDRIVEYSIILRRNDTVSNLPLQEIVSNTLYATVDKGVYNYFRTQIYRDSNRIVFDVDCDLCIVFVNYGTNKPDKDHHDWTFDSSVRYYNIYESDPKLKGSTLYGATFTIAVGATAVDGLAGSYYNLKVVAPDRSLQMIHEINSAHDEICRIDEDNGKCYMMIPVHAGDGGNDIYVYALNEGVNVTRVEIYSRFFDIQDYNRHSPEVLIKNFPNQNFFEYSSANQEMSAMLSIPVKKRDVDRYLALTIQGTKPAELRILSTYYKTPRSADFRPHNNELFVLKAGSQLDLLLGGFDVYYTEFVVVRGQITVYNDKDHFHNHEDPITLDSEDVNTLGNVLDPDRLFIHHYIDATYKYSLSIFYVRYTAVTTEGHFSKLKYGRPNNLHYHETNPFPMEYYATIQDVSKDLLVNIHLNELKKTDKIKCNDEFNVTGYVVSESWIIARKSNSSLTPDSNIKAYSKYDQSLQLARIRFDKENFNKLNTNFKYLYIKIEPHYQNIHTYEEVATTSSILPINVDLINVPHNSYYYGEIGRDKRMQIFSFTKTNINHVLMDIEYSNWNKDDFLFTLNPVDKDEPITDYYKNSSYIDVVEVVENAGRVIMTVDASVFYEIHFALFRKKEIDSDDIDYVTKDNFVIKYRSSVSYLPHFSLVDNSFSITEKNKMLNVTAKYPKHSNNLFLLINTRFTLKLYNPDDFDSEDELETFSPKKDPVYSTSNFNNTGNAYVHFYNVPYDGKNHYVTIEAVGIDASTSELLLYDVKMIKGSLLSTSAWIIGGVVLLLLIGGGIALFCFFRNKNDDQKLHTNIDGLDKMIAKDEDEKQEEESNKI